MFRIGILSIFIFFFGSALTAPVARAQSFSSFDKNCCIQRSNSSQCRVEDASTGGPCASSEYQRQCSESACAAAARDFDIEQQRKAKEEEAVKRREAALRALKEWTCVLIYGNEEPDPENRELCFEVLAKDVEDARVACNSYCVGRVYRGERSYLAQQCYFLQSETCQTYKDTPSGKFEGVPFEDELLRLYGEIGKFRKEAGLLGGDVTPGQLVGRVIRSVMGVMGSLALIIFIYGGLTWMLARGNAEKADRALKTLLWGGLGVVAILTSYAIVDFLFSAFT